MDMGTTLILKLFLNHNRMFLLDVQAMVMQRVSVCMVDANNISHSCTFMDIFYIDTYIICQPEMYVVVHKLVSILVLSVYNIGLSIILATGPRTPSTSQSYSPVQQQ